ncbi:MAG TPA: MFS transporter [Candidatus Altiarchaeales archaeon]|nr:MFS transporter [Candidatus Altiarchaeales archaeon]
MEIPNKNKTPKNRYNVLEAGFYPPPVNNFRGVFTIRYLRRLRRYGFLFDAGIVITLYSIGAGAAWFLLPQIIESITHNIALVGILLAIPGVTAILVDAAVGELADQLGRKRIISVGLILLTLLALSMHFVETTTPLILFLIFLGMLYPTVFYPIIAYIMEHAKDRESSTVMGAGMSFAQLGFGLGPVLAGIAYYLMNTKGQTIFAVIYALACICALAATTMLLKKSRRKSGLRESLKKLVFEDKLFLKQAGDFSRLPNHGLPIILSTLLVSTYDGVAWMLEPLFYTTVTDNPVWGGIILSAFIIPLILFETPAGYLADKYGRKNILYTGFFIAGVMTWLFAYSKSPLEMFAFAFTASMGIAMTWPAIEGMLARHSPENRKGALVGVWGSSLDLGYVIGPVLAGIIASKTSIQYTFRLLGIVLILSALSAFALNTFKKK